MSGLNVNEVVDLGGCNAVINGVNVGHFDEKGLKASVKSTIVAAYAAKWGMLAVKRFLNGQDIELEGELIQTSFGNLGASLPGATVVTDGSGNKKLTFGVVGGTEIPSVDLKLTSFLSGNTPTYDLTLKVTPIGDFELLYSGNGIQKWKVKWAAVVNEATGADGSYAFQFGDSTINPDVTPPTLSSVVPANAATGVNVATTVVWTFSEDLDPDTVNAPGNVALIEDGATPADVAGAVLLSNAGAATTITFTPTAPLTAATRHVSVLANITDKAGNALGYTAKQFTTA